MSRVLTTLEAQLRPEHTALLVWDCQNGLVDRTFNKDAFVARTAALLAWARAIELPIVYSKIVPLPAPWEAAPRTLRMMRRFGLTRPEELRPLLPPGSAAAEIPGALAPRADELVLGKHTTSMFVGTHFEFLLRNRGIATLLIAGISTENGIEATARDADNRGYYVVVLEDCVSSPDEDAHTLALALMRRYCTVAPLARVQSAVAAADRDSTNE
jgi:nicotinamidase-related amidase